MVRRDPFLGLLPSPSVPKFNVDGVAIGKLGPVHIGGVLHVQQQWRGFIYVS